MEQHNMLSIYFTESIGTVCHSILISLRRQLIYDKYSRYKIEFSKILTARIE